MSDSHRKTAESIAAESAIVATQPAAISPVSSTTHYYSPSHIADEATSAETSLMVDKFLPVPNRLLTSGGQCLLGLLSIGIVASLFLTYRTTVKTQAVITPVDNVQTIQSGAGGIVKNILIQENEPLSSGQAIAVLDNPLLLAKVSQIEARITQIQAQLDQVNDQLNASEQRFSAEKLWAQQLLLTRPIPEGEQSQVAYVTQLLVDRQRELMAQLKSAREQLAQTQQQLEDTTLRAPTAGTLYKLTLNRLGQTVGANETVARILSKNATLEVQAFLSDTQVTDIKVGQLASMNLSSCKPFRYGLLKGQVKEIQPVLSAADSSIQASSTSYKVTIETQTQALQSGSHTCNLLPGMNGELTIVARQEKLFSFLLRKFRLPTGA